eukprot:s5533_g10.t1
MAFSEELFRVIKADRYQGAGSSLGFGLGPIYLLQETHEPALKTTKPKGLHNDGHCFRTAGSQLVALTRCWKWNKGWKGWQARAPPQAAQPPDLAAVQAHIMAALETDLLDKIMILVEQWPQYYGSLTRALVEELVPKGLCLNPADASQAAYRGRSRRELVPAGPAPPAPGPKTSVPYERTRAPEPAPSRQRTFADLCSTKDFVEWVTAVADFQALVEPEVHGVLQAAEFGAVWRSRVETKVGGSAERGDFREQAVDGGLERDL